MQAENKAMGLEEEDDDDDDDDDESAEYYDAQGAAGPGVHSSPSPPILDEESTEALPPQVGETEDEQPNPENDKTSKRRKGKGKAEPTAAPRLSKAEQKALEREAVLQSTLGKEGASDEDVLKSTKKSKRKPKDGTIDAMVAVSRTSTPAESEPPVEGDTSEMQNPEPDAASEMSKKDKRRAKEAAKKAQQEAGSSSVNLVSHDVRFYLWTNHIEICGQQCNVCQHTFESKTKLFNHIRDEGHAATVEGSKRGKKGKRK